MKHLFLILYFLFLYGCAFVLPYFDIAPNIFLLVVTGLLSLISTYMEYRLYKNKKEKTLRIHASVSVLLTVPVTILICLFFIIVLSVADLTMNDSSLIIGSFLWIGILLLSNLPAIISEYSYIVLKGYRKMIRIVPFLPVINIVFMAVQFILERRNFSRET